jgi:hypothetical protein
MIAAGLHVSFALSIAPRMWPQLSVGGEIAPPSPRRRAMHFHAAVFTGRFASRQHK